ncbi:phosphodiester glycosidase family protein [Deinococcus yavapaiensis]|uniref:LysM domain-containing protein n=1 Tax=Deinococcus yavapaiensis KR-236 TaxID=694435 RepID=A0A318SJK7_9DEIO|nr:phosphodiester glycosidase family protein [Deinococcus yavapaiensis]PYE52748.1 LysM domain-containing protein [Deinococcus yavapaiensis KR-236]
MFSRSLVLGVCLLASAFLGALAAPTSVVVRRGDTLFKLAVRNGTTVSALQRLNGLKRTTIYVGQTLRLRATRPSARRALALGPSVRLTRGKLLGVPVSYVSVDLRDPRVFVTPILPPGGLGTGESLQRMAARSGSVALINGGYFHPRTYVPVGDLVVQGRYVFSGRAPVAVALTPNNRVRVKNVEAFARASWRGYETVVASGPHIVRNGVIVVRPFRDGFRDPAIFARAARSVLGIRHDRNIVLLSTTAKLTQSETAKIMRRLGVRDAVLLDGGSSTGLAWKGRALLGPGRKISYGIAVFQNYRGRRVAR